MSLERKNISQKEWKFSATDDTMIMLDECLIKSGISKEIKKMFEDKKYDNNNVFHLDVDGYQLRVVKNYMEKHRDRKEELKRPNYITITIDEKEFQWTLSKNKYNFYKLTTILEASEKLLMEKFSDKISFLVAKCLERVDLENVQKKLDLYKLLRSSKNYPSKWFDDFN